MTISLTGAIRVDAPARAGLRSIPVVAFMADVLLMTLSVVAAVLGRESLPFTPAVSAGEVGSALAVAGPAIVLGWLGLIFAFGGYRLQVFGAGLDEYKRVINASLAAAAALGIGCYLLQFQLSRGFFVLAFVFGVPMLVAGRFALRRGIRRARRHGALRQRVLIAGSEGHVDEIAAVLRRESWLGYQVIGALTPDPGRRQATGLGIPLLGSSGSIAEVAIDAEADVVFLAGGALSSSHDMRRLAWDLEEEEISVVIAPSVTDVSSERVSVRPVGGLPLIHLEKPRAQGAVRSAKRTFDVVGSACLLLFFLPLMAFAAARVWLHDSGPVFFSQTRVGRDGRSFRCWKFRTMVTNAEELLADLQLQQGHDSGLFKMADDPRVTRPGKWLRRFSIDELPQLLNVLTGDMSLVGPRPPLQHEVAQYDDTVARRLRVRPGMTGLWQVSGRSDLAWSEAIRLDLYYVDNWSMVQDLTILARTFSAVIRSRGAY
jgi:exopolysaccharide biosynthesis polyprenyl glycosylphosphotransferase